MNTRKIERSISLQSTTLALDPILTKPENKIIYMIGSVPPRISWCQTIEHVRYTFWDATESLNVHKGVHKARKKSFGPCGSFSIFFQNHT